MSVFAWCSPCTASLSLSLRAGRPNPRSPHLAAGCGGGDDARGSDGAAPSATKPLARNREPLPRVHNTVLDRKSDLSSNTPRLRESRIMSKNEDTLVLVADDEPSMLA